MTLKWVKYIIIINLQPCTSQHNSQEVPPSKVPSGAFTLTEACAPLSVILRIEKALIKLRKSAINSPRYICSFLIPSNASNAPIRHNNNVRAGWGATVLIISISLASRNGFKARITTCEECFHLPLPPCPSLRPHRVNGPIAHPGGEPTKNRRWTTMMISIAIARRVRERRRPEISPTYCHEIAINNNDFGPMIPFWCAFAVCVYPLRL